jgi:hypothetical protein
MLMRNVAALILANLWGLATSYPMYVGCDLSITNGKKGVGENVMTTA